ncbi:uncharacterized protein LOC143854650 [Tasmannia lanceolata]|uniref:uncharacterized protein LOC143854650 n=1 Tax=Tasmannia lanceolata TaxID=3420 RepID=UPI004063FBB0
METPSSSTRRVTRSQASVLNKNIPISRNKDETERVLSRSRRAKPLLDITNDSPIVGLAMGSAKTPSSLAKNKDQAKRTPGSGEALLRGQVKTLLQKVEEGIELPKLSFEQRPYPIFHGLLNSPALLAPTPANTPLNTVLSNDDGLPIVLPVEEEDSSKITQVMDAQKQEALDSRESLITRALLFDSPGKSDGKSDISDSSASISSVLTYEGSCCKEKSLYEDDDPSVWSIQANTSSQEEEEDREEEEGKVEVQEDYEEGEGEDGDTMKELCEGLRNICVEDKRGMDEFVGRHTRFIYNSEDEIEGEEEVGGDSVSTGILRLKGLPVPEGKHLRFPEEEDD